MEIAGPEGKHDLYIGTTQGAYRTVLLGAPGSKGPVVDHYDAQDVRAYMDRLADALEAVLGGKLGDHIRALFCDSIELSGANITDDFFEQFLERRGYDLQPFIPLVYYHPYEGYTDTLHYDTEFNDDIRRIRYDFNRTLVELFLERFTTTFDDWANEHGMQSRYQAYGYPWLMGMLDGYRLVDIPESNNWLYSASVNAKAHGYWIWNKYASSAAHLTGARIVSSEAMTNTRGVFRATLASVKKNDDFNFISGINHSILHGYNYSPPEAGFPGWVRFGAYFSDQNTWWPFFRNWATTYTDTLHYDTEFNDDIRRIRYDFNRTLVELFLERFTTTFDDWANEHGMQSRYQAYGYPWLMGMLDGYRLVDIPESNNWLYSASVNAKAHGYWIWNKYASSAAHLTGARIVSSEAMTNTRGVFRATLASVKKNDDFNFISGINHSILHGYNYSPPEAGFPGWVRFGAYFSDQNTWWPFFRNWADYNARLSALLQHSNPLVDVAILTPEADIWKQWGLFRNPFYMTPWYNHDLWEGFSRVGVMADYINEGVIRRASAEDGEMLSEEARYRLIIVSEATSIDPATAAAINDLAEKGVNFLFVDRMPSEAASYFQKEENDQAVTDLMNAASSLENVFMWDAPTDAGSVTAWAENVSQEFGLSDDVSIAPANESIYMLKHESGGNEIYFISNQDELVSHEIRLTYASAEKTAWRWDAETGERSIYPIHHQGALDIRLEALESILIVLEDNDDGPETELVYPDEGSGVHIESVWQLDFVPVSEEPFEVVTDRLFEFGGHDDYRIASFAGRVDYYTTFELSDANWAFLDLGPERHISELLLNGNDIGVKWWGRHLYLLPEGILKEGENKLEISYTTTLANSANSLTGNVVVSREVRQQPDPMGLSSDVRLLKSR